MIMDAYSFGQGLLYVFITIGYIALIWFIVKVIRYRRMSKKSGNYTTSSSSTTQARGTTSYTSINGFAGTMNHYDGKGNYAGSSMPSVSSGSMTHFDADGHYTGTSMPDAFEGQVFYTDKNGNYVGQSSPGAFGNTVFSGENGEYGVSVDGPFGTKATEFYRDD